MFPDDLFGFLTHLSSLAVSATLRRSHKIPSLWTVPAVRFAETPRTLGSGERMLGRRAGGDGGQSGPLARRARKRGVIEFGTFHLFHSFTSALSAFVIADATSLRVVDVNSLRESPEADLSRKRLRKDLGHLCIPKYRLHVHGTLNCKSIQTLLCRISQKLRSALLGLSVPYPISGKSPSLHCRSQEERERE